MAEPSFDWCSFFALFWNDKGVKCKINVPDTVLFRYGQISAWWTTNKVRCRSRALSIHDVWGPGELIAATASRVCSYRTGM